MVLIIGCGGYIGSRLALQLLLKGVAVRGLILPCEYEACKKLIKSGLDCRTGDLTKTEDFRELCKNVDCVYYLAGGHFHTIQRTKEVYIDGLRRILDALEHEQIRCFLYASNGAVYGNLDGDFHKEWENVKPLHAFGEVVLEAERLIQQVGTAFNSIILRIGEVYGIGKYNPFRYSEKQLTLLGTGQNYMSLIHEYDLLSLLEMAPDILSTGIYNVVDNMPVIQSKYYHQVEVICGRTFLKWVDQREMPERVLFSVHGLRSLNIKMSNQKIRKITDYQFRYPNYKVGLQMLWKDYIEHGRLIKEREDE